MLWTEKDSDIIYETFVIKGRFVEDANNCIAKAQNSKPYQYMSGANDEHGNPTFWSDPENVASTLARGQYAAAVARAGIPPPAKFSKSGDTRSTMENKINGFNS